MSNARRIPVRAIIVSVLLCLAVSLAAHEGHDHRVLGTVAALTSTQVEVRTKDGKAVTIALNAQTTYLKGAVKASAGDLAVGQRVAVVLVSERDPPVAKQIRIGRAR